MRNVHGMFMMKKLIYESSISYNVTNRTHDMSFKNPRLKIFPGSLSCSAFPCK